MGVTVRQKVKGKGKPWWVFIAQEGKRKSIKVGDKSAAEALASKIRERLKAGELQIEEEKKIPTFGEYAQKWLDGYGETHLKYSTLNSYKSVMRHHLTPFMEKAIDKIIRSDIRDLIFEKLKSGLAPNTVAHIKALFSGILTHALDEGLIAVNPSSRMGRLIKTKERRADIYPFTREEARDFLEAVQEHHPQHYPFFLCALRTGMRLGELIGLQWGDVDFRGGFIELRRACFKGRLITPKNGKSRRIDMSRQLSDTLKTLRAARKKEALAKGWGEVPEHIFINEAGKFLDGDNLRRRIFVPLLGKAGMRKIRIHDLRHTFASLLIQQGESLAYVKDQMGHHSIQITVDTYGHLVPGANREAVNRLDDPETLITYAQKSGCR
jgi:integrase